jgi:hypothetical protein
MRLSRSTPHATDPHFEEALVDKKAKNPKKPKQAKTKDSSAKAK